MSTVVPNNRHHGRTSDPAAKSRISRPCRMCRIYAVLRVTDVAYSCMVKIAQGTKRESITSWRVIFSAVWGENLN
jgi:hypothetical protein